MTNLKVTDDKSTYWRSIYEKLSLIREVENKIIEEYPKNEIKTPVHLSLGAEAISVGVLEALQSFFEGETQIESAAVFDSQNQQEVQSSQRSGDLQCLGTYRSHALYLSKTGDLEGFFAELYGRKNGICGGISGSMHLMNPAKGLMVTSAIVGSTLPVAVGAAFSNKYLNSSKVVVVFLGDGAIEEGVFWESLNFACVHQLRILFVIENNELAIHTGPEVRRGFDLNKKLFSGFRCKFTKACGSDVFSVIEKTSDLFEKMNLSKNPGVICFDYLRLCEHVGTGDDFATGYRAENSEELVARDPIENFKKKSLLNTEIIESIELSNRTKIGRAIDVVKSSHFPLPHEVFDNVYAKERLWN